MEHGGHGEPGEPGEPVPLLSRKDLRKQKLMEYLSAKGRMKVPNPKPYLRDDCQGKTSGATTVFQGKENKAPVGKKATTHPAGRASSSILTVRQKAKGQAAPGGSALPRQDHSPMLTGPKAAGHKRPPDRGSGRMSLCPIVRTKTGLITAVTQPRNTKCVSVANEGRSSTCASGSQRKKTLPTPALNNHVNKKATVTGCKVPPQNKSKTKPLVDKSSLSAPGGQPKSLPTFKCKAAPVQPVRRQRTTITDTAAGKPTDRSAGRVRQGVGELGGKTKSIKETQSKKGHSSSKAPPPPTGRNKAAAPVTSGTASQTSISHTGLTTGTETPKLRVHPQTAAQEQRMKKLQEWRQAKGISYKRPPMPVKPQVRHTAAVPHPYWSSMKEEEDAQSLISAVDRSLADCIQLLAEACPPRQVKEVLMRLPTVAHKFAKYWICQVRVMEQEGNLDVLPVFEEAVRVVLEPIDELRGVVFEILKKNDELQASETKQNRLPSAESSPGSHKPPPPTTPRPARVLISGDKGHSSVIKYKITATPGGPPSQKRDPTRVNGQEVRFFTPVRRSVRIERASLRYPASLQDHDLCVASYNDLISEEDKDTGGGRVDGGASPSVDQGLMFIYRQNEALKDKVLVQLVWDEGVQPSPVKLQ